MPDNITSSTPITGSTSSIRPNQMPKEPPQVKVIDPSRVTKPNAGQQTEQNSGSELSLNRTSVFNTYIRQLRLLPALNETLQKMMFDLFARKDALQNIPGVTELMKRLSTATKMERSEILQNLMYQNQNQTKFSGPVFSALRSLAYKYPDSDLDLYLAGFLKAYDGVLSQADTMKALVGQLNYLVGHMPRFYSRQLQPLVDELLPGKNEENIQHNLKLMKESIVPMLSMYASKTKDTGAVRNEITLFIHTLARLNTSSRANLEDTLKNLLDYCRFELHVPSKVTDWIGEMVEKKLADTLEAPDNPFFKTLTQVLSEGTVKGDSLENSSLYKSVVDRLVMDNSVYMPFTHLFLPVQYYGQWMFSEIWIEKDRHNEKSYGDGTDQKPVRLFISFDIKELGYFEVFIELLHAKATVELNYPAALKKSREDIQNTITKILTQNGMSAESVKLSAVADNTAPQIPGRIMQTMYEWRNAIDVSV